MSQIPFIDPSRLGPAPGGARTPSISPDQSARSFNDHLERAGRPADQSSRVETQPAAATRSDESTSRREPEVDEDGSTERPLASDPQSDAENTESSARDSGAIEEAPAEVDADQPPAAEEEATHADDVLQLSDDAKFKNLTDAAAVAASDEIGTIDQTRSAIAGSRRRSRGAGAEGSAVSQVPQEAADGKTDIPDEKSSDDGVHRARVATSHRRAAGSDVTATSDQIETEESEEALRTTLSNKKNRLSGDVNTKDRAALSKLPTKRSTTSATPGDLLEHNKPAEVADRSQSGAVVASPQSGNRSSGLVDSDMQTSAGEKGRVATSRPHGAATEAGQPPWRQPTSPAQSTSIATAAAIQTQDAESAAGTGASNVESDRPGETANTPAKLALESTGEIDRTTPQRNTITVGSRLAAGRLGASERDSVDRARFVSRVVGAFQAAGRDGGEVRLRLHPPELGVVRLEVKMEAGVITARFETETTSARTALLDNMALLRERLAEQGIKIEKFNVDLMDRRSEDSPYGPPGGNDKEHDQSTPEGASSAERLDRPDGPAEESQSSTSAPTGNTGKLNVVI